jgi:hypothetical protein
VGLAGLFVIGLVSLGVRSFTSAPAPAGPAAPSQSAIIGGGAPETARLATEKSAEKTEVAAAAREAPVAPPPSASAEAETKPSSHRARATAAAAHVAPPKTTATPSEDTLFSGRK